VALPGGEGPAVATQAIDDDIYFRAEQAIETRRRPRATPRVLGLLWDSSGSSEGRDRPRELAALDRYFKALAGSFEVRLVRFRDEAEPAERFSIEGGEWAALRRALEATRGDGATALSGFRPEAGVDAWLLCSDGLVNFGALDAQPDAGAPIHVLFSATKADPARLRALADASGGEFVNLIELPTERAIERLLNESERLLAIETSAREAVQVFPPAPSALGSSRLVIAGILRAKQATLRAKIGFVGAAEEARTIAFAIDAEQGRGHLAGRAWAALKIEALEPNYALNQADIELTGQAFGLVTRSTSLIILESVDDYVRYDIPPPAELRDAWQQRRQGQWKAQDEQRVLRLERLRGLFQEYVAWWERDFPKGPPARAEASKKGGRGAAPMVAPARAWPRAPHEALHRVAGAGRCWGSRRSRRSTKRS
ncbi:MAG: hypothetical protein MUF34_27190, partial [Polyangiaceae bacterium]|nr:hypothetical protein [Polyangiaceae bacterium]